MKRNVVVTGIGAVTPIGNNVDDFSSALYAGRSGVARITRFDPAQLPTKIAAQVKGIEAKYRDIKITFALLAAKEAMVQAFGEERKLEGINSILSMGIGLELFAMDDLIALKHDGRIRKDDLTFLNTPSDLCAHLISAEYGFNRNPQLYISACAAGTDAIGMAFEQIRSGRVSVALAGGADSMINPMGVAGFCRIEAMGQKNETPQLASCPFDSSRDGFILGEGAGFLVLEDEEFAMRRGAKILAQISGYGNSLDAYSISAPHPEGVGALKSMRKALLSASLMPTDISAVSTHGTGTPLNDPAEAGALRELFGDACKNIPVFATKAVIGHLISAAGAVESVASVIALNCNKVHHNPNLKNVGDGCELFHVVDRPLDFPLKHILKNSFGFGGQNASIVISKWEQK